MVRYYMSFSIPEGRQQTAQKIIEQYFDALYKHGPGGMRSQCYADDTNDLTFIHLKSFKKEAIANQHFKSATFKEYLQKLGELAGNRLGFSTMMQQQTFESIY